MLDEHCHIVYGVDDGSRSFDESCAMLDAASKAGITDIICSPHMRWDDFDQAKVKRHFETIKAEGAARGLRMRLGYEVFYKTLLHKGLDQASRYVLDGTSAILIEFNTGGQCTPGWEHIFYELQTTYGLDITVAHPERYSSVIDDFSIVYRMKDMGCRLEVSAGDLFGRRRMTKCAKRLIKEGLADAIVSDAHRPEHYRDYVRALKKYAKKS